MVENFQGRKRTLSFHRNLLKARLQTFFFIPLKVSGSSNLSSDPSSSERAAMARHYAFPGFVESDGAFASCFVGYPLNKTKRELTLSSPMYAIAVAGPDGSDGPAVDFSIASSNDLFPEMCVKRRMENRPVTLFAGPGLVRTAGTLNSWMARVYTTPGAFEKLLAALPIVDIETPKRGGERKLTIVRAFDEAAFAEVDKLVPFSIIPKNALFSTSLLGAESFNVVKFERSQVGMPELSDDEKEALRGKKRRIE